MSSDRLPIRRTAKTQPRTQNINSSDDLAYDPSLHTDQKRLSPSTLTSHAVLQLQRRIGNQAVQRLLNTTHRPALSRASSGTLQRVVNRNEDKTQLTAVFGDIKKIGTGELVLSVGDEGYKLSNIELSIEEAFAKDEVITFNITEACPGRFRFGKASAVIDIEAKRLLAVENARKRQEAEEQTRKDRTQELVDGAKDGFTFSFKGSAYKHSLNQQRDSIYVGNKNKVNVESYVKSYINSNVGSANYRSPSETGGSVFRIELGGNESIMFDYKDSNKSITVFHVGPSTAR